MKKSNNKEERICPVWVGYLLANPLRKIFQSPYQLLKPYISEGMQVMDVGSAMGFFTLPMAKLVGDSGKVIAIDIQKDIVSQLSEIFWVSKTFMNSRLKDILQSSRRV